MSKTFDPITKAEHYNQHPSGVECIDIVKHHDFNIGNVIKYCWRHGLKGDAKLDALKDLKKARYYLDKAIEMLGGEKEEAPEVKLAKEAITRLHSMPQEQYAAFAKTFENASRDDIERAITDLLVRGIDVTDHPSNIFRPRTKVVHKTGWPGLVVDVDWSGHSLEAGPICVGWEAKGPDGAYHPCFGRPYSWCKPEDLALPSNPVPVALTDVAPYPADSTTAVAGSSPEVQS